MPELPEVTVIVNQLNKKLKGLVLESIEYDWPKKFFWNGFSEKDLKGLKVEKVERIGKIISIKISNDITILIHLKLTGQLIYQDRKTRIAGGHPIPPLNLPAPNKTTRVIFSFTNPSTGSGRSVGHLYFNDMRKFGWVKIVPSRESDIEGAIGSKLGPDPQVVSYEEFRERLVKRGQSRIKKLLMDQNFIAGVGNIYSDEILWRAGVHPLSLPKSIPEKQFKLTFTSMKKVLKEGINFGGDSMSDYRNIKGEKGAFQERHRAYRRTGKPCIKPGCKGVITRIIVGTRSAHFCNKHQTLFH